MVREMGLEPTRLWLDTGTSSLPVYLFQHSRILMFSGRWNIISWIDQKVKLFFRRSKILFSLFSVFVQFSVEVGFFLPGAKTQIAGRTPKSGRFTDPE